MQRTNEAYLNNILEYSYKIDKYKENMAFVNCVSAFICVHLRLIFCPPQRTQRTQSITTIFANFTPWYEKVLQQRRRTRIKRIFTGNFNPCQSVSSVQSVFDHNCSVMKKTINNELKTNLNELISPSSYRVRTSSLFILSEPHRNLRCDIIELFHTRTQRARRFFKYVSVFSVLSVVLTSRIASKSRRHGCI